MNFPTESWGVLEILDDRTALRSAVTEASHTGSTYTAYKIQLSGESMRKRMSSLQIQFLICSQ
jgi:hypothetical protein